MAEQPEPAPPRLVLASASPRRAELLARLGVRAEVRPADVDESPRRGEPPEQLVVRLAAAKARVAAAGDADTIVLAADTMVVVDGRALGKPDGRDGAARMLRDLSGRTHRVVTGLAALRADHLATDVVTTRVAFRSLTDAEIRWYLDTGEPFDKAGGYGLQGAGAVLVERVEGSDTNVIGLPLAEAVELLRRLGLDLLATVASTSPEEATVSEASAGDARDVDIMDLARRSEDFRREVVTGANMQIVVMTIPPGGEIGEEVHHDIDQVLLFVDGEGEAVIEGRRSPVAAGHLTFVPGGTLHNFVNTGSVPLRLVTAYAPPEHAPGTVHATKADADADEHHH